MKPKNPNASNEATKAGEKKLAAFYSTCKVDTSKVGLKDDLLNIGKQANLKKDK